MKWKLSNFRLKSSLNPSQGLPVRGCLSWLRSRTFAIGIMTILLGGLILASLGQVGQAEAARGRTKNHNPTATPKPAATATPKPAVTATPTPVVTATPTPVVTATPTPSTSNVTATLPPQGVYDSCTPDQASCLDHLNQLAAGGFKLVLNYSQFWGNPSQQLAYADRASSLGMKVIWGMSQAAWRDGTSLVSYYPELGGTCGCQNNADFIRYVVNLVKNHPATWGYYIGDEADPTTEYNAVKTFSDLVKATDSTHPTLFIASAWYDISKLTPFGNAADVLGTDNYPVGTDVPLSSIDSVAIQGQAFANSKGKSWAQVLQAFSWGPQETWVANPRWPNRTELRQMRDLALKNAQPTILLWYSYFDILSDPQAATRWSDLVWAAGAK